MASADFPNTLQVGTGRAPFDQFIDFVRFPRMLTFPSRHQVHLPPAGSKGAHASSDSEENQFRNVAKVKPHTTPIRPAVFANLVPNDVSFVSESPTPHHVQTFAQ